MKKRRELGVKIAPVKKTKYWLIGAMFCFGFCIIAFALIERSHGIAGHPSKRGFVSWQQSLVAGTIAVLVATYAIVRKNRKELNQIITAQRASRVAD